MQITIRGEMTVSQLRQAFYEKLHELENDYNVKHLKNVTLYVNPINEFGEEVVPRNKLGQQVNKLHSNGPYRSAAEDYKI
ncbi:hypothetical protein D9M71_733520 [compost metagenome]